VQGKLKIRDTSVVDIEFNDDFETPRDGTKKLVEKKDLKKLVFRCDLDEIIEQYEAGHIRQRQLDKFDLRGNQPLHLAAKLSKFDENYLLIVEYLLNIGANYKSKDKSGWLILQEAVSTSNIRLTNILFDY
jgi:hypothetical protein